MLWNINLRVSPTLITNLDVAREWLLEKDESRLDPDNIERADTEWYFAGWVQVEVKAILRNQPLLGNGQLPNWLWNNAKGYF